MSKPRAVCKDVSICIHLAIAIQTLDALCRKKTLSILPNKSMVEDGSSCYGTLNTNNFFIFFSFIFSDFTFLFLYFPGETMKKARDKEVT